MQLVRVFALTGIIALAAGCSGSSYPTGGGGGGGGCTAGTDINVSVCDNSFKPAASPIKANSSITWTWKGAVAHNVTFTSAPAGASLPAASATQSAGTSTRMFTTPGVYNYECTIHVGVGMSGTVTVN